jgi:hypothetical protein
MSVAEYEAKYDKKATDSETLRFKALGLEKPKMDTRLHKKED